MRLGIALAVLLAVPAFASGRMLLSGGAPPGGDVVIQGSAFLTGACGSSNLGGGVAQVTNCSGGASPTISGSTSFPTVAYGKYTITVNAQGILHGGTPPNLALFVDGTAMAPSLSSNGGFTISSSSFTNYTATMWLRTAAHTIGYQFTNATVDTAQAINVASITLHQVSSPGAPTITSLPPPVSTIITLSSANTTYQVSADVNTPAVQALNISGASDITLDCQGHTVNVSIGIINADNATVKNCLINGNGGVGLVLANSNHSTISNNTFHDIQTPELYYIYYEAMFNSVGQPWTSAHLLTGNTFIDDTSMDDQVLANDITDMIVSNNSFGHTFDIAFEGVGFLHTILFDTNAFNSNWPTGFVYDDSHGSNWFFSGPTYANNTFKDQGGGVPNDCFFATVQTCSDATATAGPPSYSNGIRGIYIGDSVIP
jgi:parallel beta-helix repeat protein